MVKILVTGGAGFIGSHFIKHMIKTYKQYKIINYDALTYAGNLQNLIKVADESNYTFIKGNIADSCALEEIFKQDIDYIVNFAAETHVDKSIENSNNFINTNIVGTHVLLELAKNYHIKKYVQISTDEVYGSLSNSGYFTEDSPIAPKNPYSASKASADLLVMAYYNTFGLPINITRCSNNYGSHQYPEKLIPLMIEHALNNKPLPVYGNGLNIRDWLHVNDHCSAIDKVLHDGKIGEVYNIGGNNERTNISIIKEILKILGKDESLIQFVKDRLGHDYRYAIDASKLKESLNWQPRINFEDGFKETVLWYTKNSRWINRN